MKRRLPALLALAVIAWVPTVVLLLSIVVLGGGGALRASVFTTVLASHVTIVLGYALAVPAMLRVLHADMTLRHAVREASRRRTWAINGAFALTAVPTSLFAVSLWPEIWGTVSEVLAVQMLAVAPIVLVCQLAWMQQVADGGDAPTIAYDTLHLLRDCARELVLGLVPLYALLYGVLAANLIPVVTGPIALTLVTIPFVAWTWHTWCRATGARAVWDEPVRVARSHDGPTSSEQPAAATEQRLAPILLGGGGPARLERATTAGIAEGAWLHLEPGDSFTVCVQTPVGESREWSVYLWRPGGQWRQLEQLWNDGRTLIAHGVAWGDRAYVAVARNDGAAGIPFRMWVSVATQAAAQDSQLESAA